MIIHVTLIPYIKSSGEHKSKPTQHSVKELRSIGINPDVIVARCDEPLSEDIRNKISLFCNVQPDCVIENMTLPVLYQAPIMLENQHFSDIVCRELKIDCPACNLSEWNDMLKSIETRNKKVKIALVGKYVKLHDAYLSVAEALRHAGYENQAIVDIEWVDAELVNENSAKELFLNCDGILVPGGFGDRGIEGKICAAKFARENNIPYLGICLGMHIAVIEFAQNVLGLKNANSREFDPYSPNCVIDLMPDQKGVVSKGGTMRLGAYPCSVKEGSMLNKAYGKLTLEERHRHRYEFNNEFREAFEKSGMIICGTSPDNRLVEAVEIPENKFFVAVQYHPEFKSRPNHAHPLFREFIKNCIID